MYLSSNSEAKLRLTFSIGVFILKLRSILEADLLSFCIYFQTQKHNWGWLSILMYLFWNSRRILEVDFLNLCIYVQIWKYIWSRFPKLMYFFSNSEVYLKYTSFQQKSRSINEVLLNVNNIPFWFFLFVYFIYTSF